MKKTMRTEPAIDHKVVPGDIAPSEEQIDALARRLMPEVLKYFADEQIRQEFIKWQNKKDAAG